METIQGFIFTIFGDIDNNSSGLYVYRFLVNDDDTITYERKKLSYYSD